MAFIEWFKSSKEQRYLETVKGRLAELRAEAMSLEFERTAVMAKIADNEYKIKLMEAETIPKLERIVEDLGFTNKGVEVSPEVVK